MSIDSRRRRIGRVLRVLTLGALGATWLGHAWPATSQAAWADETPPAETYLGSLAEGDRIGGFAADAVYVGQGGALIGARFTHIPSRMPVDILLFDSVPQAMLWVRTLADSDRGEPHTAEHLVLGKGRKGRLLGLALDMSMGSNSAHTGRCQTVYHFNTAGGRQSFVDLLYRHLDALLHPDFTDEEIRREVAHWGTDEDEASGLLSLEEKGSIYLEMLSAFEKPGTILWSEVRRRLYGANHPLGLETGGQPAAIRTMEPHHLRAFLARCYRPGPGFGLILGLPPRFDLEPFLGDLDGVLLKVCNGLLAHAGGEPGDGRDGSRRVRDAIFDLPPFAPPAEPLIARRPFPSINPAENGAAVVAWAPYDSLSPGDLFRLGLLWYLVAGDETSYLYKDLVDGSTRRIDGGVTSVRGWLHGDPGRAPLVWLSGLEPAAQGEDALARIRTIIAERLAWLAALPPNSPEIEALNQRARAHVIAARRALIERTETPPRFGFRGTGDFWYDHLFELSLERGFHRDLLREHHQRDLEREMADPGFWPALARRMGLGLPRLVVAVYPDTSLPAAQRMAKAERVAREQAALQHGYDTSDPQEALRRYRADFDAATAQIESAETGIGRPAFLSDPPLTLDDEIDARLERLVLPVGTGGDADSGSDADSGGDADSGSNAGTSGIADSGGQGVAPREIPICTVRFSRMQTVDLGLYFDVTQVAREDLPYLAILPNLLAELGCWDEGETWLTYDALQQRLQREVSEVSAAYSHFPCEGGSRVELATYATGLGLAEAHAALDWTVRLLASAARLDRTALSRLRDVVAREASAIRQTPLGREEDWADNPAHAYRYQRDPIYLSARSIFTRGRHLGRIGWRLKESPGEAAIGALANRWNGFREHWDGSRATLRAELDALDAAVPPLPEITRELTAYLRVELETVPTETLREDALLLYGQTLDDLLTEPQAVLADLNRIVGDLLARGPSRVHLTGSPENTVALRPALEIALVRLARNAPPSAGESTWLSPRAGRGTLGPGVITENLRGRYPWIRAAASSRPPQAALVMGSSRTALFTNSVRLANYMPARRDQLLDCLAARLYAGAGAHGLFMRTWGAGLAYSNGIGADLRRGLATYYAERCTDGVATLRFVADVLRGAGRTISEPFYLEYALAGCFGEYRGDDTYLRRGRAMADDLADGITPEDVRRFKEGLLRLRVEWQNRPATSDPARGAAPDALPMPPKSDPLTTTRDRLPELIGPLVPGYGAAASETWGSVNFMIGPAEQVDAYEVYLTTQEPEAHLVRLYPRDFWIR